jgi:hypothetical protein
MAADIKEDMPNMDDMLTVRPGDAIEEEDKILAAFRVLIQSPFDAAIIAKVKKSQLTLDFVCNKFQCHVAFLQEKTTGSIIWPTRWAMDCLPTPAEYVAVLQPPEHMSSDAMEEDEYRGESMVCIFDVAEEVSALAIAAWFQTGLNDEFPDLVDAKEHLQELNSKLEYVSNQISLLPNLKVRVFIGMRAVSASRQHNNVSRCSQQLQKMWTRSLNSVSSVLKHWHVCSKTYGMS